MSKKGTQEPHLGLGVIILNEEGEILVGKRKGIHPVYSIPGGSIDLGESFEEAGIREVMEETGLEVTKIRVISFVNGLDTYREEGHHYVSVYLLAEEWMGTPEVKEPHKCELWQWENPEELSEPHFELSKKGIAQFLKGEFYKLYE